MVTSWDDTNYTKYNNFPDIKCFWIICSTCRRWLYLVFVWLWATHSGGGWWQTTYKTLDISINTWLAIFEPHVISSHMSCTCLNSRAVWRTHGKQKYMVIMGAFDIFEIHMSLATLVPNIMFFWRHSTCCIVMCHGSINTWRAHVCLQFTIFDDLENTLNTLTSSF